MNDGKDHHGFTDGRATENDRGRGGLSANVRNRRSTAGGEWCGLLDVLGGRVRGR